MKKIYLGSESQEGLTLMVFVEGTILKPKSWSALYSHSSYIPAGRLVFGKGVMYNEKLDKAYCLLGGR